MPPQQAWNKVTMVGSSRKHVLAQPTEGIHEVLQLRLHLQSKWLCRQRPTSHHVTPVVSKPTSASVQH